jgi:hypothetical protein
MLTIVLLRREGHMASKPDRNADNKADINPEASLKHFGAICFKFRHLQNAPPSPMRGYYVKSGLYQRLEKLINPIGAIPVLIRR